VALPDDLAVAVAALSPRTARSSDVGLLNPRPLLLIPGAADELLPDTCSRYIFSAQANRANTSSTLAAVMAPISAANHRPRSLGLARPRVADLVTSVPKPQPLGPPQRSSDARGRHRGLFHGDHNLNRHLAAVGPVNFRQVNCAFCQMNGGPGKPIDVPTGNLRL
jgi:hypothetical protein